jgi:hypothetical protein
VSGGGAHGGMGKKRGGEREVFEISPFVWFFGKKKKLKSF